jgi:alginate O-acetyltransferase complex protein AlgI
VRYSEVEDALNDRKTSRSDVSYGVHRFVTGLAKKTLLADPLGLVADQIFALPDAGLSPEIAWLGVLTYSLQLYFDFSAYSDMAIGLGRIFGFKFPENFDHPYAARSITEFWRRWHMTLSRWFRDYLYIPLGGNRASTGRTYLNLWIVFLATGIWHGAAWTFIFWGAFHGTFLIIERLGLSLALARLPSVLQRVYLLFVVMLGWTAFRAENFDQLGAFYNAMLFGNTGALAHHFPIGRYLDTYVATVLVVACLFAFPLASLIRQRVTEILAPRTLGYVRAASFWGLFVVAIISIGAASYSPFIYFRF